MKSLILSIGFLFAVITSSAQNSFLIYTIKGNVQVLENNAQSKARIGMMLDEKAQIVIPPEAAVTLICNQASLITLKTGKFRLADMKEECKPNSQSVSSNYLKYIWSELTSKPGVPEKNRKQFMSNVGAVSRSVNNIWIDPRLDTINYVSGSFPLSWKSYEEASEFSFMVFASANAEHPVYYTNTRNRFVNIKDFAKNLQPGKTYYWTASLVGEKNNERKMLRYVPKQEFSKLLHSLESGAPEYESEAAKAFRLGFLLEQAHYLGEAYDQYKKAAKLESEASLYQSTLESFKKDYAVKKDS